MIIVLAVYTTIASKFPQNCESLQERQPLAELPFSQKSAKFLNLVHNYCWQLTLLSCFEAINGCPQRLASSCEHNHWPSVVWAACKVGFTEVLNTWGEGCFKEPCTPEIRQRMQMVHVLQLYSKQGGVGGEVSIAFWLKLTGVTVSCFWNRWPDNMCTSLSYPWWNVLLHWCRNRGVGKIEKGELEKEEVTIGNKPSIEI